MKKEAAKPSSKPTTGSNKSTTTAADIAQNLQEDGAYVPYSNILGLSKGFAPLVLKRQEIQAQIKALEVESAALTEKILAAMTHSHADRVMVGSFNILRSPGRETSRLDKRKLLEVGVTPQQIERATVVSVGKPFVQIREQGEKE